MVVLCDMHFICYLLYFLETVFTKATEVPFSVIGKCYNKHGVKFTGTVLKQITANSGEDCCSSCHTMLDGQRPCTAFTLDTTNSQCYLLSNVSGINHESAYLSGHSAQKLYKLSRKDEEPMDVAVLTSPVAETERHCGLACLQHVQCLSFSWMHQPPSPASCKLWNVAEVDATFQSLTSTKFYQTQYSFIANAVPIDCALSQWSNWTDCSTNSDNCQILACTCAKNRTRSIEQNAVHAGSAVPCQEPLYEQNYPNETHVLIVGGRVENNGSQTFMNSIIDFVPETLSFTTLPLQLQLAANARNVGFWNNHLIVDGGWQNQPLAAFEVITGVPLAKEATNVTGKIRGAGCGGVSNGKFYACYGNGEQGALRLCDVYDFNANYQHSSLTLGTNGTTNVACAFRDNNLYVVGGSPTKNTFYRIDLSTGMATTLATYFMNVEGAAAVWFQDNLVVCGGYPNTDQCRLYNMSSNGWQAFANMTRSKLHVRIVNWGHDRLLAIGGTYWNGGNFMSVDDVELYENDEWALYTQLPQPMDATDAVNVGLYFYYP